MSQPDLRQGLAKSEAAIFRMSVLMREQYEIIARLRRENRHAEAAQAQAFLDIMEDSLRRHIGERSVLRRASVTHAAAEE